MACDTPTVAPGWIPDWVFCPREKILSVVVEWIISGFIVAGNWLVETIATPFDEVQNALVVAGAGVVNSGSSAGGALRGVAYELNAVIFQVAASAGPAAPFVTVTLYAGVVFALLISVPLVLRGSRMVRVWLI